jgi:hypothetical protein
VDLASLLLPVQGLRDEQVEAVADSMYARHCVEPARNGLVTTHDGHPVFIYRDDETFTHAFFTAASRDRRGWAKDVIDPQRVARVRWIVPVVSGCVAGTKCYRVVEYGAFRKPPPEKRLYVVRSERYVVWLLPRKAGGFRFKTAYVTGHGDIDRYIDRQRKIWER